ncbi:MAG: Crp/Fnr family transcriptional regulator [Polyangiales bacterium]
MRERGGSEPNELVRDLTRALARFAKIEPEHLAPSTVELFARYVRRVRYAPGETIFREHEVCRDIVILASGLVRAFYVHEAREVNLRFLCSPSIATAMASLVTGAPAEETVAAVTEVTGFRARWLDFEEANPGLAIERMRRTLAEAHYLSMERRLRMLQGKSARERYAYFLAHMEPEIVQSMPGYHVASYLGVTPESLSRVRVARRSSRRD